ncbi:MAG TPA: carboxypeptidase regulatory-like domain-containing protein [Thermoanaerobaculia bacterium]|nr:carboxypeptidase regulatory-like domain-containing protein [Thermoanaerobaculia bacterium]
MRRPFFSLLFLLFAIAAPVAFAVTSGLVASATGDPVAGATVTLRRLQPLSEERAILLADGPVTIASTTTNENGAFAFEEKLDGVYALCVTRDGFAPELQPILAGSSDLNVVLEAAPMRTGRVTAGGKPVPNARVFATSWQSILYATKTDERGHYTIPAPGRWFNTLTVMHPDFAPHDVVSKKSVALDVELTKGIVISGKVVDAAQKPVANARVRAGWSAATTADDGTFALRVKTAPEVIEAFAGDASGAAKKEVTTIAIASRPSISGAVRDANKRPLAGVLIYAVPEIRSMKALYQPRFAVSDARGNCRLEHIDGGSYSVGTYASKDFEFESFADLGPGAKNADFVAKATRSITGIVVDEQKKPVAGATVQYAFANMPVVYGTAKDGPAATALSGPDGRFRLHASNQLASTLDVQLQATRHGYATAMAAADLKKPVTLVLPKGIEVQGVVIDSDGNAVAGVAIAVAEGSTMNRPLPLDSAMSAGMLTPFVETDGAGRFTLHLRAGAHDIGAWKEGAGSMRGDLLVAAGMEPSRLVLEKGVAIRGRVALGTEPVTSGTVTAQGETLNFAVANVNEDGTFVLETLTPGRYQLQYTNEGDQARETVIAPADNVVLTIDAKGTVHGRVIDAETRETLRTYEVNAMHSQFASTEIDDGAEFTLPLPAGDTELSISADGYQAATQNVTVTAGKTTEITIALTKGRIVSGRVTAEDGSRVTELVLGTDDANADVEGDGTYTITLPPTPQRLEVSAHDLARKVIDVAAGTADSRLDIVLARGHSVRGRVVAADGTGLGNAYVSANNEGDYRMTPVDENGAFTISGLANGTYEFSAMHGELGSSERVKADSATTEEIVLRMQPAKGHGTLTGIVRGFEGSAWIAATVRTGSSSGFVGRDGRYKVERVTAGEIEVLVMVHSADGDTMMTPPVNVTLADGGEAEANFDLRADASVRGVVLEGDQPAAGRTIRFSSNEATRTTRTGANGEYEIKGMAAGVYEVSVSSGDNRSFETRHTVTASDHFDIRIDWARVEGRVVDAQGSAIAGVGISISPDHTPSREVSARSDSSGAFVATLAHANTLFVRAEKEGYTSLVRQVAPDSAPIVLTMERSEGLRVRLVDARDGRTLDGYAVAVNEAGLLVARAGDQTADGTLSVPVGAGSYRIAVSAANYASQSMRTAVPRGGELRFALTPGGTLLVQSERALGELVKLILPGGEEYVRCQCNGIAEIRLTGKTTTIDHVAPGSYTMQVLDENHAIRGSYPVTVTEGQTTTVHF